MPQPRSRSIVQFASPKDQKADRGSVKVDHDKDTEPQGL